MSVAASITTFVLGLILPVASTVALLRAPHRAAGEAVRRTTPRDRAHNAWQLTGVVCSLTTGSVWVVVLAFPTLNPGDPAQVMASVVPMCLVMPYLNETKLWLEWQHPVLRRRATVPDAAGAVALRPAAVVAAVSGCAAAVWRCAGLRGAVRAAEWLSGPAAAAVCLLCAAAAAAPPLPPCVCAASSPAADDAAAAPSGHVSDRSRAGLESLPSSATSRRGCCAGRRRWCCRGGAPHAAAPPLSPPSPPASEAGTPAAPLFSPLRSARLAAAAAAAADADPSEPTPAGGSSAAPLLAARPVN